MVTPTRIAVVGAGWWGTTAHAPALAGVPRLARLVAFVDPDPERLHRAGEAFGVAHRFPSLDELITTGLADAVVIATAPTTHYRLARQALEAGLHALVEKPFTLRAADAWALVELARDRGLQLTASHPYQHTAAARQLRGLLHDQTLGELVQVSGVFASAAADLYRGQPAAFTATAGEVTTAPLPETYADPTVAGGGHGQAQLSHVVAALVHATGQHAERVTGYLHHGGLAVDIADAVALTLSGGAVVALGTTGNLRPGDDVPQLLHYFASHGYARHDLRNGTLTWRRGQEPPQRLGPAAGEPAYPYLAPAREFAALIAHGGTSDSPASSAARSVEIVEALYRSAAAGREVRITELSAPAAPQPQPHEPRREDAR